MEDFTLPSVGARLKKGSVVHPFSQNARHISKIPHNTKKKMYKITWALLCSAQPVTAWNVECGVMYRLEK
jgi:hypothetical protein